MSAPYEKSRIEAPPLTVAPALPPRLPPPVPVAAPPSQDDDELDLGELIGTLLESRWLILAVAAFVTSGGALYALAATPVYRADAMVQVEEKTAALGGLKEL